VLVSLKFGWLFPVRNPKQWQKPWDRVYEETLEQCEAAEELGYDSVWPSEHHGVADGYCPGVLPLCAAIAMRTKRVTIGTRLMLLPLHHPVQLAEDAAVVDILSKGRFILGVAIGYREDEFPMMGVNRKFRPSLMEEGLEIIKKCWTEDEPFDYIGKRYKLRGVFVMPKPLQKPHIPIWIGGMSPAAIDRVARYGDGFHGWDVREFEAAMRRHGRDPRSVPIAESRDIYVAENEEQAWEESKDHILYVASLYREWGEADRPTAGPRAPMTYEDVRRTTFIGNPEQVGGMYRKRVEQFPEFTHSILRVPAGLEHKKVLKFMELFAREVMPEFEA
jgi:alkanesulfonate monooxygenase SsuD/methylene tetrahydromethanopterin reductase-like flavin-dependent oxidoreductase (luciferase family)